MNNLKLPMLNNVGMDEIRIKAGKTTRVEFIMKDTFNEVGVKNIAAEHRGCRFRDEILANNLFNIYSSDSCYLEVRQSFFFVVTTPMYFRIYNNPCPLLADGA